MYPPPDNSDILDPLRAAASSTRLRMIDLLAGTGEFAALYETDPERIAEWTHGDIEPKQRRMCLWLVSAEGEPLCEDAWRDAVWAVARSDSRHPLSRMWSVVLDACSEGSDDVPDWPVVAALAARGIA